MLQNDRVTTFTVSELLKENQQGGGKITSLPTQVKHLFTVVHEELVNIKDWFTAICKCGKTKYLLNTKTRIYQVPWGFTGPRLNMEGTHKTY